MQSSLSGSSWEWNFCCCLGESCTRAKSRWGGFDWFCSEISRESGKYIDQGNCCAFPGFFLHFLKSFELTCRFRFHPWDTGRNLDGLCSEVLLIWWFLVCFVIWNFGTWLCFRWFPHRPLEYGTMTTWWVTMKGSIPCNYMLKFSLGDSILLNSMREFCWGLGL